MRIAARERHKLADALIVAGPDAATLFEGWTARDLAAHVVLRDRRPDAALGMFLPQLAGHLDSVTKGYVAGDYTELVEKVRCGSPVSPLRLAPLDNAVNTMEFAVHAEDVRRGVEGWEPLPRDAALDKAITSRLKLTRAMFAKKSPVNFTLKTREGFSAGPADAAVTVTGDPLELLLFAFGRQNAAKVDHDGAAADVQALKVAKLGL